MQLISHSKNHSSFHLILLINYCFIVDKLEITLRNRFLCLTHTALIDVIYSTVKTEKYPPLVVLGF
jgi:hypothetical protein